MDLYEKIKYICEKVDSCDACPFQNLFFITHAYDGTCPLLKVYPSSWPSKQEIEETADKWIKEHPVKTRTSEFLKLFPNHPFKLNNGCIALCPKRVDITFRPVDESLCITDGCSICLKKYWSEEIE